MLTNLCQELNNWFELAKYPGRYQVTSGAIESADGSLNLSDILQDGQYFRLISSVFNDGVHKFGDADDELTDERPFDGSIWAMAVPPAALALDTEIEAWIEKYGDAVNSPFSSETLNGVYSYTKAGAGGSEEGGGATWQSVFRARLNRWRKL